MKKINMFFLISVLTFSIKSGVYLEVGKSEAGKICKNEIIKNNKFCKEKIEMGMQIPEKPFEKLIIYEDVGKKEIFLIYKAKYDKGSQKLRLKKLSGNYYRSMDALILKGIGIGIDENGKTYVNREVRGDFNVTVYFEELKDEIEFYVDDGNMYSQDEYKFYRKLQDEEIEELGSFDPKSAVWEKIFD